MALVDHPYYHWPMILVWAQKHFMTSLSTKKILTPSFQPTLQKHPSYYPEVWEVAFNGTSGPYLLLFVDYQGTAPPGDAYFWGNELRFTVDDAEDYAAEFDTYDEDNTRYIGRDYTVLPFIFAREKLLIESHPQWMGHSSGENNFVIMEFGE